MLSSERLRPLSDKTPLEAGLGFFCALDTDFIGSDILREQKPTVSASGWRPLNTRARERRPAPITKFISPAAKPLENSPAAYSRPP
ncbi:MAG: hypothetical protein ACLSUW_04200 [Akkermansia sp.]